MAKEKNRIQNFEAKIMEKNGLMLFKHLKRKSIKYIKELMLEFDITLDDMKKVIGE